jgi:hypothetical protein
MPKLILYGREIPMSYDDLSTFWLLQYALTYHFIWLISLVWTIVSLRANYDNCYGQHSANLYPLLSLIYLSIQSRYFSFDLTTFLWSNFNV